MKKRNLTKALAALLAMTVFTGILGACGMQDEGDSVSPETEGSSLSDPEKGRYVETEENLPGELADETPLQLFGVDGRLHLLSSVQQDEKTLLKEWEKQDDGFADVTPAWLSSMEFQYGGWLDAKLAQGPDGNWYLYAGYVEEDAFRGHLWKGNGDTAVEITPDKWSVPNDDWGSYEMIQGIAALDNGTLIALSYSSVDILSGSDGNIIESEALTSFYEGGVITDGKHAYLRSSAAGGQIEKRTAGKKDDSVNISNPMGGSGGDAFVIGGTGDMALDVLKDGTLIAAGEDGIFRQRGDASDDLWEKLVDGMDTDFSVSDYYCMGMAAMEDDSIYALFQADDRLKLNRYEYDPDAVSEVTQVLKLYSVYESSLLKQAAALYHKLHPQVRIDIEYEYPLYSYDIPDYDDVYKKLNTTLLGDNPPDILVLDHLNMDSYISKGLLEDLEDTIRPLEENNELLSNITGYYVSQDGKRYTVPLQFGFNMAAGRDITSEDMKSMESLAAFLSRTDYSYLGSQTTAELVDKFYPYFCDEIVKDKQLDRETLGKYLDHLKVIGENCGIISSRPRDEVCYGIWDLASQAKLAFDQVTGFMNCMSPMSMVDYIKGEYAAFENRFNPSLQTGICTKSPYTDTAKDFLLFALSEQVQDSDHYSGFPVNKASLMKQAVKDRSDYVMATMILSDDGGYIEFETKPYSQETAEKLAAICEALDKPVKEDSMIRKVLIECLEDFLNDNLSKEDTIQKVEDGLKMYLAE